MYEELLIKVCNARFGAVLDQHKDKTIGSRGSKESSVALRTELKVISKHRKDQD